MDHLERCHPSDHLPVLVVHGGSVSNIVTWWVRLPLDSLPERTCFTTTPAALSILVRNAHGNPVIGSLNDRTHLYEAGLAEGMDVSWSE